MGGARLFCLDCVNSEGDTFDTLDLCCAPESQCIEARVTYRQNINGPHEPYHRIAKLRAVVLTHHFGRTYQLACEAFERVEAFCARIAEVCHQPREDKETEVNVQAASASEPTTAEVSSESVKQDDAPAAADDTKDPPEAEPTTTTDSEMSVKSDKSDDVPTAADSAKDGTEAGPTVTEVPSKDDKADDVPTAADVSKDEIETETEDKGGKEVSQSDSPTQPQPQNEDLPTCGKCSGSLSFPFWYCMSCSG